ncbi:hypothetical protein NPX13_g11430 [Xylaria arbuscula]|uniref:SprT-like domain-containing protein n=1 Tax=Xylaria arbuscula TaxID=114810 RepID=A0A9W8N2U1_9PEZI|nr:hypothetical protein NPX13_g11430 [Xylaria arbuscula]
MHLLRTLEVIADTYHVESQPRSTRGYFGLHDAKTITRLVEEDCLAVREPSSARVVRFIERCSQFLECDTKRMDPADVRSMLAETFARLDDIIFFGLFSRHVPTSAGGQRFLVNLTFPVTPSDDTSLFAFSSGVLMIHLTDSRGARSFERLLSSMIHEMTHAWLIVFSDSMHWKHGKWVGRHVQHGKMFLRLNLFVRQTVAGLMPAATILKEELIASQLDLDMYMNSFDGNTKDRGNMSGWKSRLVAALTP